MLSYGGITVLSLANKVVKVQPQKFVRSLYGVPRTLQYLCVNFLKLKIALYWSNLHWSHLVILNAIHPQFPYNHSQTHYTISWQCCNLSNCHTLPLFLHRCHWLYGLNTAKQRITAWCLSFDRRDRGDSLCNTQYYFNNATHNRELCTDISLNVQIPLCGCRSAVLPLSCAQKIWALFLDQPLYLDSVFFSITHLTG